MKLEQIKAAVDLGMTVHWISVAYFVVKDSLGQYLIEFRPGGEAKNWVGLTWSDGVTLNGESHEFYPAVTKDNLLLAVDDALSTIRPSAALEDMARVDWRFVGFDAGQLIGQDPKSERYWVMVRSYLNAPVEVDTACELATDLLLELGMFFNKENTAPAIVF